MKNLKTLIQFLSNYEDYIKYSTHNSDQDLMMSTGFYPNPLNDDEWDVSLPVFLVYDGNRLLSYNRNIIKDLHTKDSRQLRMSFLHYRGLTLSELSDIMVDYANYLDRIATTLREDDFQIDGGLVPTYNLVALMHHKPIQRLLRLANGVEHSTVFEFGFRNYTHTYVWELPSYLLGMLIKAQALWATEIKRTKARDGYLDGALCIRQWLAIDDPEFNYLEELYHLKSDKDWDKSLI